MYGKRYNCASGHIKCTKDKLIIRFVYTRLPINFACGPCEFGSPAKGTPTFSSLMLVFFTRNRFTSVTDHSVYKNPCELSLQTVGNGFFFSPFLGGMLTFFYMKLMKFASSIMQKVVQGSGPADDSTLLCCRPTPLPLQAGVGCQATLRGCSPNSACTEGF